MTNQSPTSKVTDQNTLQQPNLVPIKPKKVVTKQKRNGETVLVGKTKLDLFLEEYERNGGNGTEAALKVFNTTSKVNAANIAVTYLKRARSLGRFHLEKKGYTYEKLVEMAANRMKNAGEKSADFVALFDRLMKIGGYEDFLTKQGVNKTTVSVLEVQKGLIDEFVEGEVVEDPQE